jgi:rod shape-determining protein MreD
MKKIVLALISIVLFIIDNTIMPYLAIKTYYPSMLLAFVMLYSIVNGTWEGLWIGAFSGILQDLYFSNVLGINALANMFVCIAIAIIGENLFKNKSFIPVIATFFIGMLKYGVVFILLYLVGQKPDYRAIFYCSLYGMVISAVIYKIVYRFSQMPFMKKEWRF